MGEIDFAKGHGTLNDFVLFTDADGRLGLTAAQVRGLCDRRAGIGGDGVLRAVRGRHVPEWDGDPDVWFMDYRNADGSIAELCGNGLRVFARYLVERGLADGTAFDIGTRAGLRRVSLHAGGVIAAELGEACLGGPVTVIVDGTRYPATTVDVGNPHAVVFLPGGQLDALDLTRPPTWEPSDAFPDGVNVEFVEVVAPGCLRLRVYERGVGETFSCGTGVVASAAVHAASCGCEEVTVDVRGGRLAVQFDGPQAVLIGPAVIVAHGRVDLDVLTDSAQRHAEKNGSCGFAQDDVPSEAS